MRRIAATLAVVVALMFSVGSAWADWEDALLAGSRGDFATAFQEALPLAKQGHADAQHLVGGYYERGIWDYKQKQVVLLKNETEAIKWYRRAAVQGHEEAFRDWRDLQALVDLRQNPEGFLEELKAKFKNKLDKLDAAAEEAK